MRKTRLAAEKRPRVLILGHLPPSQGGPATYLSAILSSRLTEQFELRPYNIGRPPKAGVHNNFGYSVLWNAGMRRMLLAIAITLRHLLLFPLELLRFRPAIVHIHTAPYWVFWETSIYITLCNIFRIPCALQLHYSFRLFYSSCSAIPRRLILSVLRRVSVFVVICRDDQRFLNDLGVTKIKSTYLPNCIDVEGVRLSSGETARARAHEEDLEILFLGGSDTVRKGLRDLLKAIPTIAQRFPEARFRLVAVPGDLVESILPNDYLGRCVIEGWVSGRDKNERLARADIFVLPSHGEGMPIAILEAMAASLPIVATDVAGIPDMIRHEQEALLIPPGDVPALAAAINRLLGSSELRKALGGRAGERVTREYDLPRGVERWESLYRSLLGDASLARGEQGRGPNEASGRGGRR
jgi:glycosyltransferase involved in cell wall biosynthesis